MLGFGTVEEHEEEKATGDNNPLNQEEILELCLGHAARVAEEGASGASEPEEVRANSFIYKENLPYLEGQREEGLDKVCFCVCLFGRC